MRSSRTSLHAMMSALAIGAIGGGSSYPIRNMAQEMTNGRATKSINKVSQAKRRKYARQGWVKQVRS